MPNISCHRMQKVVDEDQRTRMLEVIYEAVCHSNPRGSDVYHLAVNLLDRYLSYERIESEKVFHAIAGACAMISMKIRRARKECLNYEQLRYYFHNLSERNIRTKEKQIASELKWNLNAVTAADFIEELSARLAQYMPQGTLDKVIDHSHTLANVCLLYHTFMTVPPSLLACACLCDAVAHLASEQHSKCMETLAQLAGLEQDVLLQQQKNVSDIYQRKLQSWSLADTPTEIEDIENCEYTKSFTFSEEDLLRSSS